LARIAGVDLPKNERVEIGLTRIFGVGRSLSQKILSETNINPNTRVKDLTNEEIVKIRGVLERDYRRGDLRRDFHGDKKTFGYRQLQGNETPSGTACKRSENKNQCANP
jgi:ribosomal protein S13